MKAPTITDVRRNFAAVVDSMVDDAEGVHHPRDPCAAAVQLSESFSLSEQHPKLNGARSLVNTAH
jgi:hypothetical protein